MDRDRAIQLVNRWIEDFRIYLKDGGGAAGIHTKAKEALIERIAEVLEDARPAPLTPTGMPFAAASPKRAKKRKTALAPRE